MSIEARMRKGIIGFDGWQVNQVLGQNSSGTSVVFSITRSSADIREHCALKVINLITENGPESSLGIARLNAYREERGSLTADALNEVRFMLESGASLYVVRYYDYKLIDWEDGGQFGRDLLIRMEYLDNIRILDISRLTDADIRQLGMDICEALRYCHGKGILHRDIKPDNIFLTADGVYKLGDFGISKAMIAGSSTLTRTGTPAYIAPEQNSAFSGQYDGRADLYSLGLTLYELANGGRLPFAASPYIHEDEIRLRLSGKPLPPPARAGQELAKVILRACEFRPEDRFQTAGEFLQALGGPGAPGRPESSRGTYRAPDGGDRGYTVPSSGPAASEPDARTPRRKGRAAVLVLLILLLLAAGAFAYHYFQRGSDGWVLENGSTYYVYKDGSRQTGWLDLDGSRYYFDADAELQTGWFQVDSDLYYAGEDGAIVRDTSLVIDGVTYLFDENGRKIGFLNDVNNSAP